jgi:hypothetical protein
MLHAIHVLIDDAHLQSLQDITRQLAAKGFVLTQTLESIGVLAGTVPAGELEALLDVTGVLGIERVRVDYDEP